MAFQLPPKVTAQRLPLSSTSFQYVLHHLELGELGRVQMNAKEGCVRDVTYEVYGRRADSMMARRKEVFEPIAITLAAHIKRTIGISASS